ncbi:hypothetical protein CXB51_034595 [Gossypium anomalum]|uniref:Proteasome subunit beta n=1 Tax=Gossypium anomalum TaxID=47600 RepID=A0A8J6CJQ9_9ROSI|nr:hypothetical protein CXB51_034595 [Gossypium anomalum]
MQFMASKKPENSLLGPESHSQRTLYPYVTGTSVVALKFLWVYTAVQECGANEAYWQAFSSGCKWRNHLYDNMWDDGNSLGPKEVHNYLTRVMYNRRNKFNPLWNSLVLGGVKNGQKYLGTVSMIGVNFEDNHVATGFGNHLARPILRQEWHENLSFEGGVRLLEKCMRVLLYRDRSAVNKLQISKITEDGVTISQPYSLKTYWEFSAFENPAQGAIGSW